MSFENWLDKLMKEEPPARAARPPRAAPIEPRRSAPTATVSHDADAFTIRLEAHQKMFMNYYKLWERIRPEERFDGHDRLVIYCNDWLGVQQAGRARGKVLKTQSIDFPATFFSVPEGVAFVLKGKLMRLALGAMGADELSSLHERLDDRARRLKAGLAPRARVVPMRADAEAESERRDAA